MADRVKDVHAHPRAVVVELLLIDKAAAVLVDPDECGLAGDQGHAGLHARNLHAKGGGHRVHVPERGAHALSHQQAVARVAGTAEEAHRVAVDVVLHEIRIALEAARADDDRLGCAHADRLAVLQGLDADHLAGAGDEAAGGRIEEHRNVAGAAGALKDAEEPVAALLSGNLARREFVHAAGARQLLIAGVTVDEHFGIGIKALDVLVQGHRLVTEDAQQFGIPLGAGEFVERFLEFVIFLLVSRHDEAAGGNRYVAAAHIKLFENEHARAGVLGGDGGIRAGVAVAQNHDFGGLGPADAGRVLHFQGACHADRSGHRGGGSTLEQIAAGCHRLFHLRPPENVRANGKRRRTDTARSGRAPLMPPIVACVRC